MHTPPTYSTRYWEYENLLLMVSGVADWGPDQDGRQEATVDVCRWGIPEQPSRGEEEADSDYEEEMQEMCLQKAVRVRLRKCEPMVIGGHVFDLVEDIYRRSKFREKYEERYALERGEEY
jgi:hypothetical protein